MNFKIAMQKPRHLLHSQLGATFVEGAIAFGVVGIVVVVILLSVRPRMDQFSQRSQIAEAVQLASGFPFTIGSVSSPGGDPEATATEESLTSYANLVAGNSVPTCAFLVEAMGASAMTGCLVSYPSGPTYNSVSLGPVGSDDLTRASGTSACGSQVLDILALEKVSRLAKIDCEKRSFYGVTQPFVDASHPKVVNSPTHFAVQKGASIKKIGLGLGE
jgi:hypothetical protein